MHALTSASEDELTKTPFGERACLDYFIPSFHMDVIIYKCPNPEAEKVNLSLVKDAPSVM